jgi:hypothetical protein
MVLISLRRSCAWLLGFDVLREFGFDAFDAGEAGGEVGGQGLGQFVVGEADGFVDVAQAVFGEDAVFGLAENETDGGGVVRFAQEVVDCGAIEIHFASILGLEVAFFEIDHDEAAQLQVVEQEVQIVFAIAHFEPILAANKSEAAPEF